MRLQLPFNKVLEISDETFVERRDENIVVVVVFFFHCHTANCSAANSRNVSVSIIVA